jgi:ATP-dependent Clp protease ATP-binding subunit ClpA
MDGEMFERFNQPARRSLFFARYEAGMLGSPVIGTEHLLLGVLKEREPLITELLGTANVTAEALRQVIYPRAGASASPLDVSVEIPFSKDTKDVLQFTAQEADRLLHRHIGPEHVLLGLLSVERGLAWDALREKGLTLISVREALVMHQSETGPPPPQVAGMISAMLGRSAEGAPRSAPVYLMTAVEGSYPGRRATPGDAGIGFASFSTSFTTLTQEASDRGIHSIGPISVSAVTLPQFALMLEEFLRAAIIVEDGALHGLFDIELTGEYHDEDALIAALWDQLGLRLTKSL